jgi:hypothetical protein
VKLSTLCSGFCLHVHSSRASKPTATRAASITFCCQQSIVHQSAAKAVVKNPTSCQRACDSVSFTTNASYAASTSGLSELYTCNSPQKKTAACSPKQTTIKGGNNAYHRKRRMTAASLENLKKGPAERGCHLATSHDERCRFTFTVFLHPDDGSNLAN